MHIQIIFEFAVQILNYFLDSKKKLNNYYLDLSVLYWINRLDEVPSLSIDQV